MLKIRTKKSDLYIIAVEMWQMDVFPFLTYLLAEREKWPVPKFRLFRRKQMLKKSAFKFGDPQNRREGEWEWRVDEEREREREGERKQYEWMRVESIENDGIECGTAIWSHLSLRWGSSWCLVMGRRVFLHGTGVKLSFP